jgi:hypothetical protein
MRPRLLLRSQMNAIFVRLGSMILPFVASSLASGLSSNHDSKLRNNCLLEFIQSRHNSTSISRFGGNGVSCHSCFFLVLSKAKGMWGSGRGCYSQFLPFLHRFDFSYSTIIRSYDRSDANNTMEPNSRNSIFRDLSNTSVTESRLLVVDRSGCDVMTVVYRFNVKSHLLSEYCFSF